MITMDAFVEAVNTRHAEMVAEADADNDSGGPRGHDAETYAQLAYHALAGEIERLPNKMAPVAHVLAVVLEWERASVVRRRVADAQRDAEAQVHHGRIADGYAGAIGIVKSKLVVSGVRVGMPR